MSAATFLGRPLLRAALRHLSCVLAFLLPILAQSARADTPRQPLVEFTTDPPLSEVAPDQDALEVTIRLRHPDGTPIQRADLHLELSAPPTNAFFSTDFPHVEGSRLHSADVQAVDGRFSMRMVAPIRGSYRLEVLVRPPEGDLSFAATSAVWQPVIRENPEKIRRLALFLGCLALVSGASGFVVGRTRDTARRGIRTAAATATACLALLALAAGMVPESALAHGGIDHDAAPDHATQPSTVVTSTSSGIARLDLRLSPHSPRVGRLAEIVADAVDASGAAVPSRFQIRIRQLEHDTEVFSTELTAPSGHLAWKGQFFDGSPHRVEVVATPLGGEAPVSVRAALDTQVRAVAPPFSASAKAFIFLMAVAAVSMAAGFWLGDRSRPGLEGVT